MRPKGYTLFCLIVLACVLSSEAFAADAASVTLPPASAELSKPSKKEIDMSIEPSTIRLTGVPGQSQEAKIRIYNSGTKSMKVGVDINDMVNEVGGGGLFKRVYVPAGSSKSSIGKWILLSEKEFVVPSGSIKEVSFVVSPPADLKGGSSAVIFFQNTPVEDAPAAAGASKPKTTVTIQPRLGALVFFEVEGTVIRSGRLVGDVQYQAPASGEPFKISYEFENTGNTDILLSGTFHILDENNALIAKESLNPIRTFPQDRGCSDTEWSGDLPAGKYHVIVSLELGPDAQETIVRETDLIVR